MSTRRASFAREFEQLACRNPVSIFGEWFELARETESVHANAMTLATVDETGMPQARTVLMKKFGAAGVEFFTHRDSRKGRALLAHPQAALLFYWKTQARQVLWEGEVGELSPSRVRNYFNTRPPDSRIGAWASRQSRPLTSHAALLRKAAAAAARFAGQQPPPPPYWTGFCLRPQRIEFWREGDGRLHHRLAFSRPDRRAPWRRGELLQP